MIAAPDQSIKTAPPRRFDRGSWIALGLVLLIVTASATITILNLARVGDGCVIDAGNIGPTVIGACVGDWETPLLLGDELIAIGGDSSPVQTAIRPQPVPAGWIDGATIRYTVRRGGQTLVLDVPLHRTGFGEIMRGFGYGFWRQAPDWNTAVFIGVLVIFALVPRSRAAQQLLVALGGLTAVTTLQWPSTSVGATFAPAPIWYLSLFLGGIWAWLFIPTILLLVLTFPRRVWPITHSPQLSIAAIFGVPLAATIAGFVAASGTIFLVALGLPALITMIAIVTITAHTFLRVPDPVIRAQTAWLALGLAVGLAFWPLLYAVLLLFPDQLSIVRLPLWLAMTMQACLSLIFPISLVIAITRYHVFDIHVIIRRTLIYGALTTTLLLMCLGSVVLQRIVQALTGSTRSAVVTVISTLLITVLFQPLRHRIQNAIDRRFYRRKYNAQQVLESFAAQLRNETDLKTLPHDKRRV